MHLHTMTFQALGPFSGRHTIDIAALGASGLFLLEGPTGAGKSTLLDGIVFGLYGKVAAEGTSDDRLRSAFAADTEETFVDLVFEVPAGVFRVRRTPTYARAKKRGTGTTGVAATGRLWRLPADWQAIAGADPAALDKIGALVSGRLDVINQEIVNLVGLDRAQFSQTVVLPQGEFSRFLKARPEDRRVLLQRIFGTGIYERIAERLAELRRAGDKTVEAARVDVLAAGARLVGAARLSGEEADLVTADLNTAVPSGLRHAEGIVESVTAQIDSVAARCASEAAEAVAKAAAARDAATAAVAVAAEQERLDRAIRERDRLRTAHRLWVAGKPDHLARVVRLGRAHAAAQIAPLRIRAERADADHGQAVAKWHQSADTAPTVVKALLDGVDQAIESDVALDPWVERLDAHHTEAAGTVGALAAAAAAESALPGLMKERGTANAGKVAAERRAAEIGIRISARPADRIALATRFDSVRELAGSVATAKAAAGAADHLVQVLAELDQTNDDRARAASDIARARDAASSAVAAEARIRQSYLDGLAGALAADLETGQPCPVCGSVDHPDLARPPALSGTHAAVQTGAESGQLGVDQIAQSGQLAVNQIAQSGQLAVDQIVAEPGGLGANQIVVVDRASVDEATAVRHRAEMALGSAVARRERLDERADGLNRELAGRDRESVAAQRVAAYEQVTRATQAAALVVKAELELAAFDRQTQDLVTSREKALAQVSSLVSQADVLGDRVMRDEALIASARGGHSSVALRRDQAQAEAKSAADVAAALRRVGSTKADRQRWQEHLDQELAVRGMSAEDAAAAVLTKPDLADLQNQVDRYEALGTDLVRGLSDPELTALDEHATADPASAKAAAREAQTTAQTAERHAAVASQVDRDVSEVVHGLRSAAATLAVAIQDNAPVVRMAGIASGHGTDNSRNLSLAAYVLQRRFADVIDAANTRLTAMSDGRFALTPSEAKEDVTSRSTGLAMRVIDQWTGTARDPRTLSGGEAFYVSLCLALGLADVVSAEAGGVEMSTLFVDEGFGSLDPQVLDHVLTELGRLRSGGRTVGVVSHVETLKQAIADRVEVRVRGDGSSTLHVLAGA